jgi:hypothetical protein
MNNRILCALRKIATGQQPAKPRFNLFGNAPRTEQYYNTHIAPSMTHDPGANYKEWASGDNDSLYMSAAFRTPQSIIRQRQGLPATMSMDESKYRRLTPEQLNRLKQGDPMYKYKYRDFGYME